MRRYDTCVIGTGPAGATAALALARSGRPVCLVGRARGHRPGSLELLNGRARTALAHLGLLEQVLETSRPCLATVSRWGTPDFTERPGLLDPWGGGWIVDRAVLDPLIRDAAGAAGADAVPEHASSAVRAGRLWRVEPAGVQARRLVIATGRAGDFAGRTGARRTVRHRMVALTAWLPRPPAPGLEDRLLVDADRAGWWYALCTPAGTALGFCTDADLLGRRTWAGACARAGWTPPEAARSTPSLRCAVVAASAAPPGPDGPALVGDAALAADPLSGHGLALALESALRVDDADGPRWLSAMTELHGRPDRVPVGDTFRQHRFWRRRAVPAAGERHLGA